MFVLLKLVFELNKESEIEICEMQSVIEREGGKNKVVGFESDY